MTTIKLTALALLCCALADATALDGATPLPLPWSGNSSTVSYQCTLGSIIADAGCATDLAYGLTVQLIDQINADGISFSSIAGSDVVCSGGCVPFLQSSAVSGLRAATSSANDFITLNSAYRSSAQQYLLYQWYLQGKCGITAAATPGTSNHEGGLAVDTSSYSYWQSHLEGNGWRWYGPGDLPHFDFIAGGGVTGVPQSSLRAQVRAAATTAAI